MSNKSVLDEYRDKKAIKECPEMGEDSCYCDMGLIERNAWENGFNAAIELNLPVLFGEWVAFDLNVYIGVVNKKYFYLDKHYTTQELYNYWQQNILKLEP